MNVEKFVDIVGADFYTGVPDSQLKPLCDYLIDTYGTSPEHHIITANEGNAVALAAGYHLATGNVGVVYMQNSGEGNAVNPITSLLNEKVYAIPCIFVIGWRGEPGFHDEPQHIYQGEITCRQLENLGIEYEVISDDTTDDMLEKVMKNFRRKTDKGHSVAFVVRKNALKYNNDIIYKNSYGLKREEIIEHITKVSVNDLLISTTGKMSRELFEVREKKGALHETDFLTVGSMGHCSSIALGVALNTKKRVWCLDGDGAALMHLGALAVIAHYRPENFIHVVVNNGAHESVGGQPTVLKDIDLFRIACDCGYPHAVMVSNTEELDKELKRAKERRELTFVEVKCGIGSRKDLGRPTLSAIENKNNFMKYLEME